jgi:hypothetical protein
MRARVIDQNMTHDLRANSKEVCAVMPLVSLLTEKF